MQRIRWCAADFLPPARAAEKTTSSASGNRTRVRVVSATTWIILLLLLGGAIGCSLPSSVGKLGILEGKIQSVGKPEPTVEALRLPPDEALRRAAERQFTDRLQKVNFDQSSGSAIVQISLGDALPGRAVQSTFTNYKIFAPSAFSIPEIDLFEFHAVALVSDADGSMAERTIVLSITRQTAAAIDWNRLEPGQVELSISRQGDGIKIDPILWPAWVSLQSR